MRRVYCFLSQKRIAKYKGHQQTVVRTLAKFQSICLHLLVHCRIWQHLPRRVLVEKWGHHSFNPCLEFPRCVAAAMPLNEKTILARAVESQLEGAATDQSQENETNRNFNHPKGKPPLVTQSPSMPPNVDLSKIVNRQRVESPEGSTHVMIELVQLTAHASILDNPTWVTDTLKLSSSASAIEVSQILQKYPLGLFTVFSTPGKSYGAVKHNNLGAQQYAIRESVLLLNEAMTQAMSHFSSAYPSFSSAFPGLDWSQEVPSADILYFHLSRGWREVANGLPAIERSYIHIFFEYMSQRYEQDCDKARNRFLVGEMIWADLRYLARPGEVLVQIGSVPIAYKIMSWPRIRINVKLREKSFSWSKNVPNVGRQRARVSMREQLTERIGLTPTSNPRQDRDIGLGADYLDDQRVLENWVVEAWTWIEESGHLKKSLTSLKFQIDSPTGNSFPMAALGWIPYAYMDDATKEILQSRGSQFWTSRTQHAIYELKDVVSSCSF